MTKENWERLAILMKLDLDAIHHQKPMTKETRTELTALLEKTREVDEHPEDWDWGCLCQLCCSYGD